MEPPQTEREQKLSALISKFVGQVAAPRGICHYVDNLGSLSEIPRENIPRKKRSGDVRVVAISDTHERHDLIDLPPGDVLLHCGDLLMFNAGFGSTVGEHKLRSFNRWLSTTPHKERVVIGGNHDYIMETLGKEKTQQMLSHCIYLQDEHVTLECGLTIFGTPVSVANTKQSPNRAFQYASNKIEKIFSIVPPSIDILMTHGTLDTLPSAQTLLAKHSIPYYFCGHVHEEHGVRIFHQTIATNASTMSRTDDNKFQPSNPPVVMDIPFSRISTSAHGTSYL